jgi:predicted amino acid dehydrogenase
MERFAFVIHPFEPKDVARKGGIYSLALHLPDRVVESLMKRKSPIVTSHITGIRSATGAEAEGWFIGCPLTPRQFLEEPEAFVYNRLVQCGEQAIELGAKIIGLGAFSSVVGDGGLTVAQRLGGRIAVTTGNSYTVATAVEGAKRAAALMDTPIEDAHVAIVGAAGSIGRTCALLLATDARQVTLVGRNRARLEPVLAEVATRNPNVAIAESVADGLADADLIVTVTSAADAVILPEHLKRGAVVCDVARPRDVSARVSRERPDVLTIEGGVVSVPGEVEFNFEFGFPKRTAYACMSETMMLALDGRYENFTLGKEVSVAQAEETQRLAAKHGFKLAGFRSFEKEVTDETIAAVRRAAGRKID